MFSPNVDMQEVISSVVEMKLEIIRGERWFVLKTAQERYRSPDSLRLKRVKGERGGGGEDWGGRSNSESWFVSKDHKATQTAEVNPR